jgi:LCP family protein required for cell wall assembly
MDSSRFKRRQIQTAPRQIRIDGFRQRPLAPSNDDLAPVAQPIAAQPVAMAPTAPIMPARSPSLAALATASAIQADRLQPAVQPPTPAAAMPDDYQEPAFQTPEQAAFTEPTATEEPAPKRRLRRIDMGLPGDPSPEAQSAIPIVRHSKLRALRRWSFRIVAVAMILLIGTGGLLFSQGYLKLHKVLKGGAKTAAALTTNVDPTLLKGEGAGRVNVLLLGRGGGDHDGPDLTDTMMLASIDPVNKTETLLSLPRDLYVNVPNQGSMKINAAWETGEFKYEGAIKPGSTDPKAIQAGFDQADQSVESVLGVNIDYNVIVDFSAFQQAVTTVGGVTVNVPTDLVDPTMAWENGNNPILAKAGTDTFNGKQALTYVRSRETSSDFARAERQRAVLLALKQKAETLDTISNPLKLSGLINAFGNNVSSDFSLSDASRMFSIIKSIPDSATNSISLDQQGASQVTTANIDGQSVVEPLAGLYNYGSIQNYVRSQLPDPYLKKENAKVMVLNGTTVPGLATTEANTLKSYGYNVTSVSDAPTTGYVQSVLVQLNSKDKYTSHYLQQRLNLDPVSTLPDNTIQPNGADFVIIVGSDDTTTSN